LEFDGHLAEEEAFDDLAFAVTEDAAALGDLGVEGGAELGHGVWATLGEAAHDDEVVELVSLGLVAVGNEAVAEFLEVAENGVLVALPSVEFAGAESEGETGALGDKGVEQGAVERGLFGVEMGEDAVVGRGHEKDSKTGAERKRESSVVLSGKRLCAERYGRR